MPFAAGGMVGWPLGEGKPWANKATVNTNLISGMVQIETALEMFKKSGAGHLVHMPSHIWYRLGRWRESLDANVRAAAAAV